MDLGPIVNEKQLARVDGIVQRSVAGGARLVAGGTHEGLFYRPTVLADVTTGLPVWTDETFGPVAPVVVFDSDDEAVALANDSEYGLAAGVYSRSISRGLWRSPTASGRAWSTSTTRPSTTRRSSRSAGMGISGNGGRFGGEASLEAFTEWQWVTVRDKPRSFGPTY